MFVLKKFNKTTKWGVELMFSNWSFLQIVQVFLQIYKN